MMKHDVPTRLMFVPLALALAGCGGGEDGADGGSELAPTLYAVQQNLNAPEGRIVYVNLIPSLDAAGAALDLSNAIELNGYSTVQAFDGALFTSEEESREITRWEIDARGRPTPVDELSFANVELDTFWNENFLYLTPERAYYANAAASEIIVWNPKAMEITGRIPIPGLDKAGLTLSFSGLTRVGDRVFLPVAWSSWESNEVYPHTVLVALSATEDAVLDVWEDERCGVPVSTLPDLAVTEDGTYYLVGDAWYGSFRYAGSPTPKPACVLRVLPGADGFDPEWAQTLNDDLDGYSDMSTLLIDEERGHVYSQLLKTPPGGFATMDDVWTYMDTNTVRVRCDLATWSGCEQVELDGVSHWFTARLDGRVVMTSLLGEAADCVVWDMQPEGPARLFRTDGFISNIVRIR